MPEPLLPDHVNLSGISRFFSLLNVENSPANVGDCDELWRQAEAVAVLASASRTRDAAYKQECPKLVQEAAPA